MMSVVMLAGVALGASARPSPDSRFFGGWFAQTADQPDAHGDNHGGHGGARPGPSHPPPPPEVRPQGDLRGDIYNHLREQRQSPWAPPSPASDPRQRQLDRNGR
jgi:hypothetical protein